MASAERPQEVARRLAPGLPPGGGRRSVPFMVSGRIRGVRYAVRGIALMLRSQHNAWVHAAATLVMLAAGFVFGLSAGGWAALARAIVGGWGAVAVPTG